MDWYSWLSKSGLEPSLAYDYSLLFTHNELEEDDIAHFDHEFLLSMGISIAKHRLEILKLAKKSKRVPQPVARLMSAVGRTKKCLARYFSTLPLARVRSAIVIVPKTTGIGFGSGARWKGGMLKRNKRLVLVKQGRLMITDGGVKIRDPASYGTASPLAAGGVEEIRWDSMFQDLKPT